MEPAMARRPRPDTALWMRDRGVTPADQAMLDVVLKGSFVNWMNLRKSIELRAMERAATACDQSEAEAAAQAYRVATAMRLRAELGIEFDHGFSGGWRVLHANQTPGFEKKSIEMWSIDENDVALRIGTDPYNPALRIWLEQPGADNRLYVLPWQLALEYDGNLERIKMTLWAVDASRLADVSFVFEPPPNPDCWPPSVYMVHGGPVRVRRRM